MPKLKAIIGYSTVQPVESALLTFASVTASSFRSESDGTPRPPEDAVDKDADGSHNTSSFFSTSGIDEWWEGDLGSVKSVGSIAIAFYAGDSRTAWFEVHTSVDGTTYTPVLNGEHIPAYGVVLHRHYFANVSARYIKIINKGNSSNNLMSVYAIDPWAADNDLYTPNAPTLNATPSTSSVQIDLTRAIGPWEDNFVIERATDGATFSTVHTGTELRWSDTSVVDDGTVYTYRAKATNSDGDSAYSATDSATLEGTPQIGAIVLEMRVDLAPAINRSLSKAEIEQIFPLGTRFVHGGVGTDDFFVTDGNSSTIGPDYNGEHGRVVTVRHRANEHYGGTWNSEILFGPNSANGGGGYDYVELTYKFMYGSSWNFSKTLGKTPGLTMVAPGGHPDMSDPYESPAHCVDTVSPGQGASFRHTTVNTGLFKGYYYLPAKPKADCGIHPWPRANGFDTGEGENADVGGSGSRKKWVNGGWVSGSLYGSGIQNIQKGQWHTCRQVIRVSTNEVWEYVDGVLQSYVSGQFCNLQAAGNNGETLINGIRFDPYIGSGSRTAHYEGGSVIGGSGSVNCNTANHQSQSVWTYFRDFKVNTLGS